MKDFTVINRDDKNKRYHLGTRKTTPELPPNSFASLLLLCVYRPWFHIKL